MSAGWTLFFLVLAALLFVIAVVVLLFRRPPGSRIPPLEAALALVAVGLASWIFPSVVAAAKALH